MLDALYDLLYTMLPAHIEFHIQNSLSANTNERAMLGSTLTITKHINIITLSREEWSDGKI